MSKRLAVAVLISGNGSNLQALIDACQPANSPAEIVLVISNHADAYGLQRAQNAGIATAVLSHKDFASRAAFDQALLQCLQQHHIELICLAGFMRILTPEFVATYAGRILNVHPSLLPKFPGLDTHARALAAGESEHGASIHFVTAELDGGPVIVQGRVAIAADDTVDSLAAKVHQQEHRIYPQALHWFASGRLGYQNHRAYLDGHELLAPQQG